MFRHAKSTSSSPYSKMYMVTESVYKKVVENINDKEKQDVSNLNKVIPPKPSFNMDSNILTGLSQDDLTRQILEVHRFKIMNPIKKILIKIFLRNQSVF